MLWPCLPVRTMASAWLASTRAVDTTAVGCGGGREGGDHNSCGRRITTTRADEMVDLEKPPTPVGKICRKLLSCRLYAFGVGHRPVQLTPPVTTQLDASRAMLSIADARYSGQELIDWANRPVYGRLPGPNRAWLLVVIFHTKPVSFPYTSHVTTMFTYRTPTRHPLLAAQKRA